MRLLSDLRICARLVGLNLRAAMEYEADFWIGIVGMGLTHVTGFLFVWTIFANVPAVAGWGLWETAFLYGLSVIPRGLAELFCDGPWVLLGYVNRGEFDRLLVRPFSPALQLIFSLNSIHGVGNVLVGALILGRAATALDLGWGVGLWLLLLFTLVSATVMITAISLLTHSIAFWEPAATSGFPFFVYQFQELTKFPIDIYHRTLRLLLTWIIPFACISYYPGLLLLGKPGVNPWLGYSAPLATVAVVGVAAVVWRRGLARYQGTGH